MLRGPGGGARDAASPGGTSTLSWSTVISSAPSRRSASSAPTECSAVTTRDSGGRGRAAPAEHRGGRERNARHHHRHGLGHHRGERVDLSRGKTPWTAHVPMIAARTDKNGAARVGPWSATNPLPVNGCQKYEST